MTVDEQDRVGNQGAVAAGRHASSFSHTAYSPLMTRQAFAQVIGLPVGVLVAQAERGYWPQITIGKRVFINVEAIRLLAAERAAEFSL
ncbi:hypothetical protein [Comamonas thiooxydans]|uniref:hypothetical protein n=1 Tax=Comamonas thiooxydans TaxID=363952 RepID=UPI0011119D85|nr:hypothetical protein [Comamonas thiooxydans]